MKQKRTSGSGLLDKLLVPRIENYGTNNDITDTGAGRPVAAQFCSLFCTAAAA